MVTKFTKAGLSATLRHAGFKSISLTDPTNGFFVRPNLTVTFQLPKANASLEKTKLTEMAEILRGRGAAVRIDGNTLRVSNPADRKAKAKAKSTVRKTKETTPAPVLEATEIAA